MQDSTKGITRRQIIAGVGAATAGLGAVSVSGCLDSSNKPIDIQWESEADLIVVGSGIGSATAAIAGAEKNASVILLEKAPIFGGTSAKTEAVVWVPNNFTLREKGIKDDRSDCLEYLARFSYPELYNQADEFLGLSEHAYSLLTAFYDNAYKAADMLKDTGTLQLAEWRMFHLERSATDYLDQVPENKVPTGRALGTVSTKDGKMGNGVDMMSQFEVALNKRGVDIKLDHQVQRLIVDENDRVIGVVAGEGGKTKNYRARKGVVFGTGGYAHNPEKVASHQRNKIYGSCAIPMATGDFIDIAAEVGAKFGNMSGAWRSQVVLEQALKSSKLAGGIFLPAGDSMFQVNKYGQRVANEKRNYNDRTEIHSVYDPGSAEYKNQFLFMVFDQRAIEAFAGTYPYPEQGETASYIVSGESLDILSKNLEDRLEALSTKIGGLKLDQAFNENLKSTFERFNSFAESGVDTDFQRGRAGYDSEWHQAFSPMRTDTPWPPNKYPEISMHPLNDKGPYYAVILAAGALDTNGGPVIDAQSRVIGARDKPISGLYGAGNCIASPSREAYWGAGCPLGLSMTFGYIAANTALSDESIDA